MTSTARGETAWRPSGVVTLTTDFGQRDAFVGVMKGVLLGILPSAVSVDLTHEVAPQDVRAAAFHLRHAWRYFPRGTVHVAVVDPGVGSERAILLALEDGHAFLAPDNGLLSGVISLQAEVRALDVEAVALADRSRTFHGRDVFAPAAARLARGDAPATLAPRSTVWKRLDWPTAQALPGGGFEAPVELLDRFGNAITALTRDELDLGQARGWTARVRGTAVPLRGTYAEVAPGEPLALLDSCGRWEIAVRDGDAGRRLGISAGDRVQFHPRAG